MDGQTPTAAASAVTVGELLVSGLGADVETSPPASHGPLVAQFGLELGGRIFAVVIHDCGARS